MKQKNPRDIGRPERPAPGSRPDSRSAGLGGAAGPDASSSSPTKHTVASGESLSAIARRYYGTDAQEAWMRIYQANKAIIGADPDRIRPGQELLIPGVD